MAKYILSKQAKGKKFQYTVTDENGNIVSTRMSIHNYVACTANGEFYFRRLDLIGRGTHGIALKLANAIINNPEEAYKKQISNLTLTYRLKWLAENPVGKWVPECMEQARNRKTELEAIAYLQ